MFKLKFNASFLKELKAKLDFLFDNFVFNGQRYRYFVHQYNWTWLNERAIEVPIVYKAVKNVLKQEKTVLEIGNVLAHYFPTSHLVVDKYEQAAGVFNQDVVLFDPQEKFDLIVSISTLEHIGWDEDKRSKGKIPVVIKKVRAWLKPGGKAIFTFSLGHNQYLDKLVEQGQLKFDELFFLQRVSKNNHWEQIKQPPKGVRYGYPFCNANVIGVGVIR